MNTPELNTPEDVVRHFDQHALARRWRKSPRTLERWRRENQGPPFLKIGHHILYRVRDILEYEETQRRTAAMEVGEASERQISTQSAQRSK